MTRPVGLANPRLEQPVPLAGATASFLAQRDLRSRSITVYGQTLARLARYAGPDTPLAQLGPADLQAFMDTWYAGAAAATWNLNLAALRSFTATPSASTWSPTIPARRSSGAACVATPTGGSFPLVSWNRCGPGPTCPCGRKRCGGCCMTLRPAPTRSSASISATSTCRTRPPVTGKGGITRQVNWYTHTAHLLPRIIGGRTRGPLFLADRLPRRPIATLDLDPATGRARLSYRRAAECFTTTTGWTLHQLRHTRIRELKDDNCPLPVLQKITGHRSLRTLTEHYPGPSTETVRAWYENTDPDARRRRGSRA